MVLADLITLAQSGVGWSIVLLYAAYELYAPRILGKQTALGGLVDLPDKVEDIKSEQRELRDDVDDIQKQNEVAMQVQRAQARASDDMDHEQVDDYLLENGVTPDTFLVEGVAETYRADGSGNTSDEVTDDDDS